MTKLAALFLLCFVAAIFSFATWQLFSGNFTAAFSALPFLVISYLFVKPWKR